MALDVLPRESMRVTLDGGASFFPVAKEILYLAADIAASLEDELEPAPGQVSGLRLALDACDRELGRLHAVLAAGEASNTRNSPDGLA